MICKKKTELKVWVSFLLIIALVLSIMFLDVSIYAEEDNSSMKGRFQLLTSNVGLQSQIPILIDKVAYEIKRFNDGTGELYYYDFEKEEKAPYTLSNNYDEERKIVFDDCVGSISPIAINGSIYVVKCGHPADSYGYPGAPSFFSKIDLNTGEINTISFSKEECIIEDTALATDNKYLYCMTYSVDLSNDMVKNVYLTGVDLDTLHYEHLVAFDPQEATRISGVCEKGLVIVRSYLPKDYTGNTVDDLFSSLVHSLQIIEPLSGEITDPGVSWVNGSLTCAINDGIFYYVKCGEDSLFAVDLLSGNTTRITTNLCLTYNSEQSDVYLTGNIVNGYIEYHIVNEEVINCLYNIAYDKAAEISLTYKNETMIYNMTIICADNDWCLINCGIKNTSVDDVADDGTIYESIRTDWVYGLISLDDYWESKYDGIKTI